MRTTVVPPQPVTTLLKIQLCGKSGKFKYPLVEFIFKVFIGFYILNLGSK